MFVDLIPVSLGVLGLAAALLIYRMVLSYSPGQGKVVDIAEQIHTGAMTFMRREYTILFGFAALLAVAIWISELGGSTAAAFVLGALCSSAAGYIGMYTATRANVRTTVAANEQGAATALTVAFFGGSIMGLTVAAMGLLGLGSLYLIFGQDPETAHVIHGFGMGASKTKLHPNATRRWLLRMDFGIELRERHRVVERLATRHLERYARQNADTEIVSVPAKIALAQLSVASDRALDPAVTVGSGENVRKRPRIDTASMARVACDAHGWLEACLQLRQVLSVDGPNHGHHRPRFPLGGLRIRRPIPGIGRLLHVSDVAVKAAFALTPPEP